MDIDDTPSKATFSTKNYGLLGENKIVQYDQHFEHNVLLNGTTLPCPLRENPHTQTHESLENVSGQSMVIEMTDTILLPEPGYPDYSIYLPLPLTSESENEGCTTTTPPMDIG